MFHTEQSPFVHAEKLGSRNYRDDLSRIFSGRAVGQPLMFQPRHITRDSLWAGNAVNSRLGEEKKKLWFCLQVLCDQGHRNKYVFTQELHRFAHFPLKGPLSKPPAVPAGPPHDWQVNCASRHQGAVCLCGAGTFRANELRHAGSGVTTLIKTGTRTSHTSTGKTQS